MKHTNNLKLALYESDDAFNITGDSDSLNSNMNIIDESINSLNNEKASKALYGDTTINIGRRANTTVGEYSTAEGNNTVASGKYSHTEGSMTTANGNSSHAEGYSTTAQGIASHSEGQATTAKGNYSHAEGYLSKALGDYSHVGGSDSIANSLYSFAHGKYAIVNNDYEVAFGKYNTSNTDTLFSVGDGTLSATHNAFEITTDGGKLHDKDIATTDMLSAIQDDLTSHTHDSRYYTEAEIDAALAGKANTSHTHTKSEITDFPTSLPASDVSEWAKAATKPTYTASEVGADASGSANTALTAAKAYTDTEIAGLINGAPTTLDTLGEIATAMSENQSVVEALNSAVGTKANVSDLNSHINNKSNPHSVTKSQVGLGNVPNVATNDQTPSYTEATSLTKLSSGEKLSVAFGKISKAITDLISHIGDSVKHITSTERTNWNAAKTHADSAHAPSNAQANVIETVKVNGTALTPSSKAVDITVPSYSTMTGATSSADGTSGLVPAPASGERGFFLRGDGTWAIASDSRVKNTLNTTTKAYITGTTSSSTNTGTQIFDTGVYLDTTAGMLTATTFKGALLGNASTATTANASKKLTSASYTTLTISTSDWTTNSSGGYKCTKTLSTAMSFDHFNFEVVLSTDQSAAKLQIASWNYIMSDGEITQTTSSSSTSAFTFYAFTTKPTVALTVAIQGVS